MIKKIKKPAPSNAPTYCAMYPDLATIARNGGYALAVHGSMQRDFDLIFIPWIEEPLRPIEVINKIIEKFALTPIGEIETTWHGRRTFTLSIGYGECFLDLSFMPIHS